MGCLVIGAHWGNPASQGEFHETEDSPLPEEKLMYDLKEQISP